MLNVLRPCLTRLLTPVGQGPRAHPDHAERDHRHRHGRRGRRSALPCSPPGSCSPAPSSARSSCSLDMLDGVLARLKGTSGTWGAFLDSTMDRIADAAVFGGLVIWF